LKIFKKLSQGAVLVSEYLGIFKNLLENF